MKFFAKITKLFALCFAGMTLLGVMTFGALPISTPITLACLCYMASLALSFAAWRKDSQEKAAVATEKAEAQARREAERAEDRARRERDNARREAEYQRRQEDYARREAERNQKRR